MTNLWVSQSDPILKIENLYVKDLICKFKKKFKSYDQDFLNDNYDPLDLNVFKDDIFDDLEEIKKNRSKLKYD